MFSVQPIRRTTTSATAAVIIDVVSILLRVQFTNRPTTTQVCQVHLPELDILDGGVCRPDPLGGQVSQHA